MQGRAENRALVATALILVMLSNSAPAEQAHTSNWLDIVLAQATPGTSAAAPPGGTGQSPAKVDVFPEADESMVLEGPFKPSPLTFGVKYMLVTDYIFRGINMTEYRGEGRERPNHQLELNIETETGYWLEPDLGAVGMTIWFNWWGGQQAADRTAADNLHEVDYTFYWTYRDREQEHAVEIGLVYYTWPRRSNDVDSTQEVYVKVTIDDRDFWAMDRPMLKPFFYYGLDIDLTDQGSWIEVGVEHKLSLADVEAFNQSPVLRYMTITPSLRYGLDNRYLHVFAEQEGHPGQESTRCAFLEYRLDLDYDLTGALNVDEQYGNMNIAAFVSFSDALREHILNDELYGGIGLGYRW